MSTLLTARSVREIAHELGLRPTKTRGQNFVIDPNTVRMIVEEAQLTPGEQVVEIGPGLGSLTLGLLEAGHPVTAVEIDTLLASRLPRTIDEHAPDAHPLTLITDDALHVTELPTTPTALVANLPYNVAVPVLMHFLETFPSLTSVLVMVQAEVADRLAANPGSRVYGAPSVKAKWYGAVTRASDIGKNVFWPAPNVGSGLVRIVKHTEPYGDEELRRATFDVVNAAFAQRRKTLRQALAGLVGSGADSEQVLVDAGVDPKTRGEALDIDAFITIARTWRARENGTPDAAPQNVPTIGGEAKV